MGADVDILLLAAGRSTRMQGRDKLMEEVPALIGSEPLLRAMTRRCLRAGPTRVVLGPGQDAREAAIADLDAQVIHAPAGAGMAASIVAGVTHGAGPVLLVLADMPEVTAHDMHLLISLSRQAPGAILRAAGADGTPGHPVLFPADLRAELGTLQGDTGARRILTSHEDRVHLVPLEGDRALVDLDTPEDWAAWRATQES